ncbi:MAG: hypothetical protein IJJ06_09510 [Mogibacterium sp.]|nr:hypothetical protein [Mogibacterium sp.]
MKRKYTSLLMIIIMMFTMFAACSKEKEEEKAVNVPEGEVYESAEGLVDENGELVEQEGSGIEFEQEEDNAKLAFVKKDPSAFYGSWTATSDKAIYLYGNIDITVKENGTWTGNITGEKLGGKWEQVGDHLHMDNDLFSFDLSFESSGEMILIETGDDYTFNTVMTKKQ